jgi:GAF domain-containing protein
MKDDGSHIIADSADTNSVDVKAELTHRSEDLVRADSIRRAVMQSAAEVARLLNPDLVIPKVLKSIGAASGVSRIQLYKNETQPDGRLTAARTYEWDAPGLAATARDRLFDHLDAAAENPQGLPAQLAKGDACVLLTREAKEPFRHLLESNGVVSLLLVPVFGDGEWWGQIEFDDCHDERFWSPLEYSTDLSGYKSCNNYMWWFY